MSDPMNDSSGDMKSKLQNIIAQLTDVMGCCGSPSNGDYLEESDEMGGPKTVEGKPMESDIGDSNKAAKKKVMAKMLSKKMGGY